MKLYEELSEKEREKAIIKNYQTHLSDDLDEENTLRVQNLIAKVQYFENRWCLDHTSIEWERDNHDVVTFRMSDASYGEEEVNELFKKHKKMFDEEAFNCEIERYEEMSGLDFELSVMIYENKFEISFARDWVLTKYLRKESFEKRMQHIDNIQNEKVVNRRKKYKLKQMFGEKRDNEEIDEIMRLIVEQGLFEFEWVKKIEEKINKEFIALKEEVESELEYLYSEQFVEDVLKRRFYIFDEELTII